MSEPVILHLITNLELGGGQISTARICAELRRRGWRVHLAYSPRGGELGREDPGLLAELRAAGVELHPVPAMRRRMRPLADACAFLQLLRLIRRLRPAVVHTHLSKAGILGRLAAAAAGTPHLAHTQRGWSFYRQAPALERRAYTALERLAGRFTGSMLAVSHAVARDGVAAGIGAAASYRVVPSGIDLAAFAAGGDAGRALRAELGIAPGVPVVGSVMGLVEAKAPLDFVAAAGRIARADPRVRFVVAGDGPLRDAFLRAVEREGMAARFHWLGVRGDVSAVLAAMDVFLLASRWEGLPRVVLEAAAAGVPVVATAAGGTGEVVRDGVTGVLAAPGQVEALAAGCLRLLGDPALAGRMAAAARAALPPEADLARVVDAYEDLYRALLAGAWRVP